MSNFVRIASVDEIPMGSFKAFEVNDESILVVHTADDGYFALINQCSHDAAPISDGKLALDEVICTRHGARFDVKTGEVRRAPAVVPIETFELKIEGNDLLVQVDE